MTSSSTTRNNLPLIFVGAAVVPLLLLLLTTAYAQPTPQQQQSSVDNDVQILSSTPIETSIGSIIIIGEVRNNSPEVVGTIEVVGRFYDSSGRLIDTTSAYADLSQVRPGEKSPFRLAIADESVAERMDNYTLSVNSNPVFGEPKPAALRIEVSEQRLNENGWYDIVGEIINTGNSDTSLVEVIAMFYDDTGKLIESEFTFLTSAVPAGQSAPFKITEFNGDRANEAAAVKLTVESNDYVIIDPELEQQQQQSLQGMGEQQNDTATSAASPSQATTEPLSTDAATSSNNTRGSAAGGIVDAALINQLTARAISYAEQANTDLQSNDTEGASRNLNLALNELESIQGNLTSSTSGSNSVGGTNGESSNTSSQTTTSSTPSLQSQQQELQPSSPFSQQLQSEQQQEQEEGAQQQQLPQQSQNEGGASVSIVEDSSARTTDAYSPNPVQVSVGSTVTWTNDDAQPHTATSGENSTPDGRFDSGIMAPGATFEHTFTEAGEYPYFCLLHPNQVGTVNVG